MIGRGRREGAADVDFRTPIARMPLNDANTGHKKADAKSAFLY